MRLWRPLSLWSDLPASTTALKKMSVVVVRRSACTLHNQNRSYQHCFRTGGSFWRDCISAILLRHLSHHFKVWKLISFDAFVGTMGGSFIVIIEKRERSWFIWPSLSFLCIAHFRMCRRHVSEVTAFNHRSSNGARLHYRSAIMLMSSFSLFELVPNISASSTSELLINLNFVCDGSLAKMTTVRVYIRTFAYDYVYAEYVYTLHIRHMSYSCFLLSSPKLSDAILFRWPSSHQWPTRPKTFQDDRSYNG